MIVVVVWGGGGGGIQKVALGKPERQLLPPQIKHLAILLCHAVFDY